MVYAGGKHTFSGVTGYTPRFGRVQSMGDRWHWAMAELEKADQYWWAQVLETSSEDKSPALTAMQVGLSHTRLTMEVSPLLTRLEMKTPNPNARDQTTQVSQSKNPAPFLPVWEGDK